MKILITGATGFVGRALCKELFLSAHELTLVLRQRKSLPHDWGIPAEVMIWDPTKQDCPHDLEAFEAVIHLMGESVASGRWTVKRKERLQASRVLATQRLLAALSKRSKVLNCFIGASAIGYYPFDQTEDLLESSAAGEHFLAKLCQNWEAAAQPVRAQRLVTLRIGLVLGHDGGAMARLRSLFAAGLGGRLGAGHQIMSWIHRDDLVSIIKSAIQEPTWQGVYNCVSPHPVSNREFTHSLAATLQVPAIFPVPALAMQAVFGEMSDILLKSQKVSSKRIEKQGFTYKYPKLSQALAEVCSGVKRKGKVYPCRRFETQQFIPRPLSEVFGFFCTPNNLERITPTQLKFRVLDISTAEICQGTSIRYQLKLYGIPFSWTTLIEQWQHEQCFVDSQERGPFAIWHHTHRFYVVSGGTLMLDELRYRLPLGRIGEFVALSAIRRQINSIFAFRRQVIAELFPA